MFEDQYRKYCREIMPSPALDEETVALMQEAQNHRAAPAPTPLRWRPAVVLPIAGTAAAAVLALVITGSWLLRDDGETFDDTFSSDMEGVFDTIVDEEDADNSMSDMLPEEPEQDAPPESDEDLAEGDDAEGDTNNTDTENKNQSGTSAPPMADTDPGASKDDTEKPENTGEQEKSDPSEEDGEEEKSEQPDEQPDEQPEGQPEEEPESDEDTDVPVVPSDPYGPEVSHDKDIDTYLSIREFIDALAQKETTGYGKNYYNARELLIVPNLLPDGARFRHLHLNTKNGKYSYSYYFAKDGRDYIIDIEVNAKTPKNLNELRLSKQHIAIEEVLTAKKDDQLFFLFGEQDEVTVTLTDVKATVLLTEEETAALLKQFKLERCSLTNTIVNMKY